MDDPAKHTLDALRAASDTLLYRSLVEQVPAVVYIHSNEHHPRSLYVSPQCLEMFGHTQADFLADRELWGRCIHPDDREWVLRARDGAVDREEPFEAEYRWLATDGEVRWVRDRCALVRTDSGQPLFRHGLLEDISISKSIEQALKESMERYRFLVENIPAVVYLVANDDDRRTLYVSPQVERALGYTRDEWLDQPDIWMELLHPDDREITLADHDDHNDTGKPWSQEYRLIASDGRAVWFRDVANLVRDEAGKPLYWLGVQLDVTQLQFAQEDLRAARDDLEHRVLERTAELEEANELLMLEISERRRVEEDLRAAEHRYRLLAEQIPAVTYVWQTDGSQDVERRDYMSPRVEEMLGFTAEEWCRTPDFWMSRLHPDDRTAVLAATMRSETTGEPFSMEYRYLRKDGRIVWVLDEAVLISRDDGGRPHLFQGVAIDITGRKEAEASARENEARFRGLAEQVPGIIYVLDARTGDLTYVSPQITAMLGYQPGDVRTASAWRSTVHEGDRERVFRIASKIRETGEPFAMEYRVVRRDGRVRWVRDQGVVVSRLPGGAPREVQGIIVDVTSARHSDEGRGRTAPSRARHAAPADDTVVRLERDPESH